MLLVFVVVLDDTLPTLEELLLTPLSSLPCLELETMLLPHPLRLLSPQQAPELPLFLVLETLEDTLPPMELLETPLLALIPVKDEVTVVHAITIHSTVARSHFILMGTLGQSHQETTDMCHCGFLILTRWYCDLFINTGLIEMMINDV